jgi:multiple sugar transport system substrate-binding protein
LLLHFISIKRWIAIIAIVLFLSIFGGCQTKNSLSSQVTEIVLWHGINPPENRDVFNALVDKFNREHPDIRVEGIYVGQPDGQLPKILASVVSGRPPDMLWYVAQLTGKLVELDAILPLDDWFENLAIKAEIAPAMFDTISLNGHIMSIPFATNNVAMFYRPSIFKEADIDRLPETWDELRAIAKKLTQDLNGDGRIDRHGLLLSVGKGEWAVFAWLPFIYSAGGELLKNNRPNFLDPAIIQTLQFGSDLVNRDRVAILSPPERGYELDSFLTGRVAMQVTGPWTLGQLKQTLVDYGVFPIPHLKMPATVLGGENLYVFKTTPERERASKKFLEYVLSEEFQTTWALKTGYLPINLKAQQNKEYQKFVKENPVLEIFLSQMKLAKARPMISEYTRLSENLGRAIESSLLNKQTAAKALSESQKRLELIFEDN